MSTNIATFENESHRRSKPLLAGTIIVPDILRGLYEGVEFLHVADNRVFRDETPQPRAMRPQARRVPSRRAA